MHFYQVLLAFGISTFLHGTLALAATPLNKSLKPTAEEQASEDVSSVFRDMGVVQRKAMNKSNRFLLSGYGALDFSDGPYSMYAMHLDPGYAFSDMYEIYFDLAPFVIAQARPIVAQLEAQRANGVNVRFDSAKATSEYGASFIWAPLYGKDSLGAHHLVRSDTFLKFGVARIAYDIGDSGLKFSFGAGKTYFISQKFGLRITGTGSFIQTILNNEKTFHFFGILETGVVIYL